MKSTILTQSGIEFDVCNPDPDLIEIEDIAHALSHLCRFTGHTKHFYSVAQHSYLCTTLVPAERQLETLLHDAAEAYIGDVSSPLKAQLPGYQMIESKLEQAIRQRFGLPPEKSPWVKQADLQMLAVEKAQLMPQYTEPWDILNGVFVPDVRIELQSHGMACQLFLTTFNVLQNHRSAA
jgi:hypothetical protein